MDNRTEFRGKFEGTIGGGTVPSPKEGKDRRRQGRQARGDGAARGIKVIEEFNTGFDVRYQHVRAYDDYFNEPSNTWDLSAPRQQINYVNFGFIDRPVPGYPGQVANPGFDQRGHGPLGRGHRRTLRAE